MRVTTYDMRLSEDRTHALVKEAATNYAEISSISCASDIARIMCDVFGLDRRAEEHVYMMALNSGNGLIGIFEVSRGSANSAMCGPREIFSRALLAGAVSIIIAHNHTSGSPTPSKTDRETTKTIEKAGGIIGVRLIDHIIIAGDGLYHSMAENGEIERRGSDY